MTINKLIFKINYYFIFIILIFNNCSISGSKKGYLKSTNFINNPIDIQIEYKNKQPKNSENISLIDQFKNKKEYQLTNNNIKITYYEFDLQELSENYLKCFTILEEIIYKQINQRIPFKLDIKLIAIDNINESQPFISKTELKDKELIIYLPVKKNSEKNNSYLYDFSSILTMFALCYPNKESGIIPINYKKGIIKYKYKTGIFIDSISEFINFKLYKSCSKIFPNLRYENFYNNNVSLYNIDKNFVKKFERSNKIKDNKYFDECLKIVLSMTAYKENIIEEIFEKINKNKIVKLNEIINILNESLDN
ncbi:MAG TPA: hypothetical protein PKY81_14360 [bacterium]|nr:hypothetical protein [bacterium]